MLCRLATEIETYRTAYPPIPSKFALVNMSSPGCCLTHVVHPQNSNELPTQNRIAMTTPIPNPKSSKNTMADDQHLPEDIRQQYKGRLGHELAILTLRRPFNGSRIDRDSRDDPAPAAVKRKLMESSFAVQDSSGIDAYLYLLRHLLSFDLQINDRTNQEAAVVKAAWLDVGVSMDQDHNLKHFLLKNIFELELVSSPDCKEATFDRLLHHQHLRNVIIQSDEFQFFCTHAASEETGAGDADLELKEIPSELFRSLNKFEAWDGTCSLQQYIIGRMPIGDIQHGSRTYIHYVGTPRLLHVPYTSIGSGPPFADIRTFQLDAETIWQEEGEWVSGRPSATYVLLAVVRMASEHRKDDIRFYWKRGGEIVPENTQLEVVGKNEFREEGRRWTVKDKGEFVLFYFRLNAGGLPVPADFHKIASEFAPRDREELQESDDVPSEGESSAPAASLNQPPRSTESAVVSSDRPALKRPKRRRRKGRKDQGQSRGDQPQSNQPSSSRHHSRSANNAPKRYQQDPSESRYPASMSTNMDGDRERRNTDRYLEPRSYRFDHRRRDRSL